MNRLGTETSPYLRQHQDNPVDWWPWCDEAIAEARRLDKPILLSIGYSACHWCHVMAHESFEDPAVAAVMNEHFVNIKVDREERPDLDAVYMTAVQLMTGQGGWPMTSFLTPDGEPFYCGTYFPPEPRHGLPSFTQLLLGVAASWRDRRGEVTTSAAAVTARLREASAEERLPARPAPSTDQLDEAAATLRSQFDNRFGGFGSAPKFPPSMCLEFLLRHYARTGNTDSLAVVERTCAAMARGGMYDQLGGGFARYSVDHRWVVPHFEKMLYDNALLMRVYLHWWRATGSPLARRIALETADWVIRDLRTAEGGFASALDADSLDASGHLHEGAFYVWTPDQVGPYAASTFTVTAEGTFEHATSVLQLLEDPADPTRFAAERARLLALRDQRPAPARDDKVVAAWNGLAIAALAETGALLDRPDFIAAAEDAAALLLTVHLDVDGVDTRLARTSLGGTAGRSAGVLEDYADVAEGLLTLHQVTGEERWLGAAAGLLETVLEHFGDHDGGLFDTADDAEALVARPQNASDNASPSGVSAAAGALLTHAALTGLAAHRDAAEAALGAAAVLGVRAPRFFGWALAVAEALAAGPLEVAVVGSPDLLAIARLTTSPGAVVVGSGPLTSGRPKPAAYVCRGFVCHAPTTDPGELASQVGTLPFLISHLLL